MRTTELQNTISETPALSPEHSFLQLIRASHGREFRRLAKQAPAHERRIDPRYELSIPFLLYPVIEVEDRLLETRPQPIQAVAHDFSRHGLGFRHDDGFSDMLAIGEFDSLRGTLLTCLLEIRWRLRKAAHHHLAGAQLVRVLGQTGG